MTNIATNKPLKHQIAILLFDDVVLTDALLAYETFSRATLPNGEFAYHVFFCSDSDLIIAAGLGITPQYRLDALPIIDTLIVPGVKDVTSAPPEWIINTIQCHAKKGGRILSICTGSFILSATGLLNNLSVTTHWMHTNTLQKMYPLTKVNPNVLYIDNGQFLTSAGAIAGIDLCLYVVGLDFGNSIANDLAKMSVVQRHREGGQKQFINNNSQTYSTKTQINTLLDWLEENLADNISIQQMADRLFMSTRTFNRKFTSELGITPTRWLTNARVQYAQRLLETSTLSFEQISDKTGLGSTANFRRQFNKLIGTNPREYKKAFCYQTT